MTVSQYRLAKRSLQRLAEGHALQEKVVKRAIELCDVDFTVIEVLRTREKQEVLVADGASKTMNSRHLTGHAVDLGAWVNGSVRWDWEHYFKIAKAMQQAAIEYNVRIVWGGCWECINDAGDLKAAQERYIARKKKQGKKPFLDGPHFELTRADYPEVCPVCGKK
ncbi:M15 family metallopeptidase [Photobacterium japonica]|uniref:M15 family metallopeptidase n=1 Tax=Photobacterium japonica TaxID=2910235 RepID=UPI003D0A4A6C